MSSARSATSRYSVTPVSAACVMQALATANQPDGSALSDGSRGRWMSAGASSAVS